MSKHASYLPGRYLPGTASIDITAPGGIDDLLAFHRATFGDAVMEAGADGEAAGVTGAASGDTAGAAAATGFPANTPWREMEPEQQVAYWQHQARKHEDRATRAADYDAVVAERDRLRAATLSDAEKAIEDARKESAEAARAEVRAQTLPALVRAEFKAAAAGRVPADALATLIAPLDLTKFLTADGGEVDADKVQQYVAGIAPVGGKTWPDMGQARRGDTGKATGVSAGRSLYEDRHAKK